MTPDDRLIGHVVLMPGGMHTDALRTDMLLSIDPHQQWRGFSFGNFWFGYYFSFSNSPPRAKGRMPPPV